MRLIIVRHAIAEDRDSVAWPDDGVRPLTKRGRRRFEGAARGLSKLLPDVDLVLSSPYVRAWDTASILAQRTGWPAPVVCDELRQGAPEDVLRALEGYKDLGTVAIVGHEPYLSQLIGHLISPSSGVGLELRKGAAACVDLSQGDPRLLWLLQPRVLRLLA
ncbi:MAG TPA: histidine phosphatase family protein [Dehalococcoidia bacterium]|nr:histidine phosphatase family protein [Dehalococcoidia bacterium]